MQDIIVKLSDEDRMANHLPDWVFDLCHENNVFYEDMKTGELIQVLDFRHITSQGRVKFAG